MAEKTQQKKFSQSEVTKQPKQIRRTTQTEAKLEAVMAQLDDGQHITDKHIDKYFKLKSKMVDAVRDDHKDIKEMTESGRKYNLFYLIAAGVIVLVVIILIGIFDKDYLGQFFQLLFAFLGGTGLGSYVTNQRNQSE